MTFTINLREDQFTEAPRCLAESPEFRVIAQRYPSGVAALTVHNSRGYIEVLPFMGGIIWDAQFDGISLRMKNMFSQPRPAREISDTYGCFAFHSGLLAAGCPSPDDTHVLHGEFSCAAMDRAWIEIDGCGNDGAIRLASTYEYARGFGDHYRATPTVSLGAGATDFIISMDVENLSPCQPMPLQYMCHMNYAFVPGGVMRQSLPAGSFQLRRSIPAHVTPTPEWIELNNRIIAGDIDADSLEGAESFNPEIVYFADDLPRYGQSARFELTAPEGHAFFTEFSTAQFPVATRWILWTLDQQVAAFVLPGTSRPEGFLAAKEAGTLIWVEPGGTRSFRVHTGLVPEGQATELSHSRSAKNDTAEEAH
ncbi:MULTISPECIES: aldose 1-epimerase family protein [Actinotignum]|nr:MULTISPECIES: aldose 1-epimerase family protein [Actinotignum]MDE1536462.1 aldose 1-epimerase family protein [Actinotignum schaalii]MDK7272035.1 aldose 1-epimerase family protein [Actinotignum schaalii]MDY5129941.1 aldose 1-epimerase family protein [Actinotignum timonense]MDY5144183.1 aldose 1-epimerase family protein [Actinotignum timonense]MDY5149277.1 aldose 1-epimerase family protein [Actinotignum timonense]